MLTVFGQPVVGVDGSGRIRASRLELTDWSNLSADGGLVIDPSGEVLGDSRGVIGADVQSAGRVIARYGYSLYFNFPSLRIAGDYDQHRMIDAEERTGTLQIDFDFNYPGDPPLPAAFVPVQVDGAASLAGGLRVTINDTFNPAVGERFEILRVDNGFDGEFDVAEIDPLPDGKFFSIEYDDNAGAESVWLEVKSLMGTIGFDPENPQAINGSPTAAVLGDLTGDGLADIAVTLAGTDAANDPGKLIILKNASFGGGQWTGYEAAIEYAGTQIGVLPSWIDAGDLDGDGDLDLAVSNFGTPGDSSVDTVTVIINEIVAGDFTVDDAETFTVGDAPSSLRIDHYDDDGFLDIVVANSASGDATVMYGLAATLPDWPEFDFPPPAQLPPDDDPWGVRPGDLNPLIGVPGGGGGAHNDLVFTSRVGDSVIVFFNEGARVFSAPQTLSVGDDPVQVLTTDLNDDDLPELITVNRAGGSNSVLRNISDGASTAFAQQVELPLSDVPTNPSWLANGDFDADDDQDLAIVAEGDAGSRVVKVLRNDTTIAGGTVLLSSLPDIAPSAEPWIVLAGDVTNDGADDIVTIASSGGPLNRSPANDDVIPFVGQGGCRADMTTTGAGASDPGFGVPDGDVTAADIQFYANLWVADQPGADFTTQGAGTGDPGFGVPDGLVTAGDIQFYVNEWIAGCP